MNNIQNDPWKQLIWNVSPEISKSNCIQEFKAEYNPFAEHHILIDAPTPSLVNWFERMFNSKNNHDEFEQDGRKHD